MTFEDLKLSIDKKRIKKNSKWEWVYIELLSCENEYILKQKVKDAIINYENSYPKDVFKWDNKEKLNFNRGRFNQNCYEILENTKQDILKELGLDK